MHIGDYFINRQGHGVTIKSMSGNDIVVVTDNGNSFTVNRGNLAKKVFKVRDVASVCQVGYIGFGKYPSKEYGKHTKAYQSWRDMLRRCYDESSVRFKCYGGRGIYVCSDWHNFQNFAEWYNSQHTHGDVRYHLEKDFLCKNIYSPSGCLLLPSYLNASIVDTSDSGGRGYLSGNAHRLNISILGTQYQLPDVTEEDEEVLYDTYKNLALDLIIFTSGLLGHINNSTKIILDAYVQNKYKMVLSKSILETWEVIYSKVLVGKDTILTGIDNSVEIINLYHEHNIKRMIKFLEE